MTPSRFLTLLVCATVVLLSQLSPAQPNPTEPATPIDWIVGPKTGALGDVAEVKIPQGYKFAEKEDVRLWLESRKVAVPKGVVGGMISINGGWQIYFMFDDIGYVKEIAADKLDATGILKTFASRLKEQPTWKIEPTYDPAQFTCEWAFEMNPNTASRRTTYSVQYLARRGVLTVSAVCTGFADLEALRDLAKSVSFKPGQAYGDYQPEDKVCAMNLNGAILATTELGADSSPAKVGRKLPKVASIILWAGVGLVVAAAVAGLALVVKRMKNAPRLEPPAPVLGQPEVIVTREEAPAVEERPVKRRVKAPGALEVARESLVRTVKASSSSNHHGSRRKKAFDYNRYFADLMSTVAGHTQPVENPSANGYTDAARADVPTAAGTPNANGPGLVGAAGTQAELIAGQAQLIEEQRRIIQEQSKLIEEKSKLISEKNHLLKLQSELMDAKLL